MTSLNVRISVLYILTLVCTLLNTGNWGKMLLYYEDGRFAKDEVLELEPSDIR